MSVVIFLSFISFIINRAKSKDEAKQVQHTSPSHTSQAVGVNHPDADTKSQNVFIVNAKVFNPVYGLDYPVLLLYLLSFHVSAC